jgi:adenylate cyclase
MATKDPPSSPVHDIKSAAFRQAALESERIRIYGVLTFIGIFVIVTVVRVFVVRTSSAATPWVWQLGLAVAVTIYEAGVLRRVNLALKSGRTLPAGFWTFSTILETSLPAFVIAFLASPQLEPAYRPLASPALLVFFIFIILSTLRLNFWICILSGAVAIVTYLAAALYLG